MSALLPKNQPQSVCTFKLLQEHSDKNNKATGAFGPTRLHCGVPLVEDLFIFGPSLLIMVNNLVRCEQPLSAMVIVKDTCPHLDLDTAHDIPAEVL